MSKMKTPNMSAFLGAVSQQQPARIIEPLAADDRPKRIGRPPKAPSDLARQTAIRFDPEDLKRLKKLAVDDDMTLTRLIYLALDSYCATRGVKLVGVNKK